MHSYEEALNDPEIVNRPNQVTFAEHLPDDLRLAFSVSCVYAVIAERPEPVDGPPDALPPAGYRFFSKLINPKFRDMWLRGLANAWGVTNSEEAILTANYLLDDAISPEYVLMRPQLQELVDLPQSQRSAELDKLRREASARSGIDLNREFTAWAAPFLNPRSAECLPAQLPYHDAGLNILRAGNVLRLAMQAGLMNAEESYPHIERTLTVARANFGTWRELVDSYLVGRVHWKEGLDAEHVEYRDAFAACLNHPELPWAKTPLHATTRYELT